MKIRTSKWNGKNSIRIQVETKIGSLWFGGAFRPESEDKNMWILYKGAWRIYTVRIRKDYKSAWIIYNGLPFSWQISSFRPRLGAWNFPEIHIRLDLDPDSAFWKAVALSQMRQF